MHLREVRDADIGQDFHENTFSRLQDTGIKGYRPLPQTTSTSRIHLARTMPVWSAISAEE